MEIICNNRKGEKSIEKYKQSSEMYQIVGKDFFSSKYCDIRVPTEKSHDGHWGWGLGWGTAGVLPVGLSPIS